MLTSLVLELESPAEELMPLNLGRASHALFLRLVRERDAGLAGELHDAQGPKPFTCSNLVGGRRRGPHLAVSPDSPLWLRFTGLTKPVSYVLQDIAAHPPAEIELDGRPLRLRRAALDPDLHPWAGQDDYPAMLQRFLLSAGKPPERRITIHFASPTAFHSGGRNVPLPLPHLIFGSLLERWQAFADMPISAELRRYAEEMVALARYDLRTRILPFKEGAYQVGFVGQATFLAMNQDRYWVGALHLLAAFAFYAGVGYQTAVGMGQARPAPSQNAEDA
ncbi:MAG: CRISPR system precrRNA processing endoribonuclease RAMP protein Cas6 [Anaerolineae bacterium]